MIRTLIQTRLSQITSIKCGVPIPDGMVEDGVTYFGYEIQENYLASDYNKNYDMEVSLTGRLVRRVNPTEGSLAVLESALEDLKTALKDINFKYSYNDVTTDPNIRKMYVSAVCRYSEINNNIVV